MLVPLSRDILVPKELMDIVRADPQLVAKVITIVNSPLYGVKEPITNINHAIIFLGILQFKNIATQFVLQRSVAFSGRPQELAYKRLSATCFLASNIGLMLAKELNMENSAEISTRCLLSYIGDIAILSAKPELARLYLDNGSLFSRVKQIQASIGSNPAMVGRVVAQKWKLPGEIVDNLSNTLLPLVDGLEVSTITEGQMKETLLCYYACCLADFLVFDQGKGAVDIQECSF
jgi:HD-like signal output (HDOD) protein